MSAAQPQPAQSSPTQSCARVVAKVSPWQDQKGYSVDIFDMPRDTPSPELFVYDDNADEGSPSNNEVSFLVPKVRFLLWNFIEVAYISFMDFYRGICTLSIQYQTLPRCGLNEKKPLSHHQIGNRNSL